MYYVQWARLATIPADRELPATGTTRPVGPQPSSTPNQEAPVKIRIDKDLCSGHGRCYVLAPSLFTDDDEGYGEVIGDGEVSSELRAEADRAVGGCPERAIVLED